MDTLHKSMKQEEEKVQYYGTEVAHLILKKEYGNFLTIYVKKLYEHLIKYQTLSQAKIESDTHHAKKDTKKNKETQTQ